MKKLVKIILDITVDKEVALEDLAVLIEAMENLQGVVVRYKDVVEH